MPTPPHRRRSSRAAVAALGAAAAAGLIVLAAAPAAFADEPAPELVVGGIAPIDGLKPGSTFDVSATVANKSSVTAHKVWVSYSVTRGLDLGNVPSNCQVQHVRSYDEMPEQWTAACAFDQAVESGVVYTTDTPLRVTALDRALNEDLRLRVWDGDPWVDDNGSPPVAGTAPAVKLVEAQGGVAGTAAVVTKPVTAVNTADYQVTGAALKGNVGDTVPMKVTFTNAGPAWVMPRPGDRSVSVKVTPPAGTTVVKRASFCRADGKLYSCGMRSLYEGSQETYTFQLKIDKRVAGAKGSVALSTEPRPFDPNKANDKADITLDVTGGGSTGGAGGTTGGSGGSSGGSSSTGGAGGSTGGSGGTTGGSSSTGGSSVTGGDGTTTNGGDLASTGSSTLPIATAAAAAVATGTGLFVIARRRRARNLS